MRGAVSLESGVEHVTVFARGARVRRVSRLPAPLPGVVRFAGLPLAVIDDTVRAEVTGPATVTLLRVGVDLPGGPTRPEHDPALQAAHRRVALADADVERLRDALAKLGAAELVADDPTDEPLAPWHEVVAARRSLVTLRSERERSLREALAGARRECEEARRALEVASERDRATGSARAARVHEVKKYVELELAKGAIEGDIVIHVEYQVAAARWAPSYVARLDGDTAHFEMRAVVAQDTGEDWMGVALRLSTAEPDQFAPLPELHPQKIGRRQLEPARRGFRAPPAGADALYADYDQRFPRTAMPFGAAAGQFDDSTYEGKPPAPPPLAGSHGAPVPALGTQVWDEGTSRSKDMYPVMPGAPAPLPVAMPAPPPAAMPAAAPAAAMPRRKSGAAGAVAKPLARAANQELAGASAPGGVRERAEPAALTPRLDYGSLRMAPPSSPERGKLVPAPPAYDASVVQQVAGAIAALDRLPLPPGHVADWIHTYDYAFASDGKVDIRSDRAWHGIALTSRTAPARVRHVAVPREQPDVFRMASIDNPFDGPLLPGPIDVYDRGQFLVTSEVDYTPPGAPVEVGLGVDATVKIARNTEFHEAAAGMLRGALRLVHAIAIDVENLSPRAIDLEVRERVPVTREGDDDVEVALGKVDPPWERWTPEPDGPRSHRLRGGYRWRLTVPVRAKKQLRAGYEVKIAGKHELIGGNRRES